MLGLDWKNKMFMPASAARYYIHITNFWVEPLQDLIAPDAIAEGIPATSKNPTMDFYKLWDSINKKEPYQVADNPYVFVYEYKMLHVDWDYTWDDKTKEFDDLPF